MMRKCGLLLLALVASTASSAEFNINRWNRFGQASGASGFEEPSSYEDASGYAPFIPSYEDPYAAEASERSGRSSLNYDDEAPLGGVSSHTSGNTLGSSGVSSVTGISDPVSRYDNFGPSYPSAYPPAYPSAYPSAGSYSLAPSYGAAGGYGGPYGGVSAVPAQFLKKHHYKKFIRALTKANKYAPLPLGLAPPYDVYDSSYGAYGDYYGNGVPSLFQLSKHAIKFLFKSTLKSLFSWWPFHYHHHPYDGAAGGYYA